MTFKSVIMIKCPMCALGVINHKIDNPEMCELHKYLYSRIEYMYKPSKQHNMKPFDLKLALNDHPVITQAGHEVRIAGHYQHAKQNSKVVG